MRAHGGQFVASYSASTSAAALNSALDCAHVSARRIVNCRMRNQHGSRCSRVAIACVATAYAWQPRLRQISRTTLRAKRAKKVDREAAWAEKKAREAQDKARRKGRATDIAPATVVANGVPIPEDHRFEQFFYDAPTSAKNDAIGTALREAVIGLRAVDRGEARQ